MDITKNEKICKVIIIGLLLMAVVSFYLSGKNSKKFSNKNTITTSSVSKIDIENKSRFLNTHN